MEKSIFAIIANKIGSDKQAIIGFGKDELLALQDAVYRAGVSPALIESGFGVCVRCTPDASQALYAIEHLPGVIELLTVKDVKDDEKLEISGGIFFPVKLQDEIVIDFKTIINSGKNISIRGTRKKLNKLLRKDPASAQLLYAKEMHELLKNARAVFSEACVPIADTLLFPWGVDAPGFSTPKIIIDFSVLNSQKMLSEINAESDYLGIDADTANILSNAVKAESYASIKAIGFFQDFLLEFSDYILETIKNDMSNTKSDTLQMLNKQTKSIINSYSNYHKWSCEAAANRARQLIIRDMLSMEDKEKDCLD